MDLHLSAWPDIEAYLASSKAIVIPVGSTEQHGPTGLLGTDCICPQLIAKRAGDEAGFLVGPTFNVGQAQHHMGFPGTMTVRPSTMIAAMYDWTESLTRHGFERIYWLNGHGGNVATLNAAFAEIYLGLGKRDGNAGGLRCTLRNWWELPGVLEETRRHFPIGEGSHATPSEISVTWVAHPEARKEKVLEPRIAPIGPIHDAADYRRRFPDGRIGSDPSQANIQAGEAIVAVAVRGLIGEFTRFAAS